MIKQFYLLLIVIITCHAVSCSSGNGGRERILFTDNWSFALTEATADFSRPGADDSGWRILDLPHDWSIESDFSGDFPATPGGGALPGGMGWYRKQFTLPETDKGKQVYIDFDGVYWNSKVWINGHLLGHRPNGYISFRYDLTPYLLYGGQPNLIAVQVDNSEQPNSRWYSGSGIYRNVWLVKTGDVHVDNWGTYITTPQVSENQATAVIETTLKNKASSATVELTTLVKDPDGVVKVTERVVREIPAYGTETIQQKVHIDRPIRWSLDNPALYTAVTEVRVNGQLTDNYETTFGIRTFRWDSRTGFYLNDEAVKILGVCMHHDLGCLGTAVNTRAIERQLEIMKEMGVNSIRTSHNPPAPELLDLCDRMGLLVQDESFDMWRRRKVRFDYSNYFDEWYERDLADQVMRDRNHASVFMWSIGNEVLEQWPNVRADGLSLAEANLILNAGHKIDPEVLRDTTMSVEQLITHTLAGIVRSLDTTRVITAGSNEVGPGNQLFRSGALDVYGFNYHHEDWEPFLRNYPGGILHISESTSGLMTRGYYEMPSDNIYIRPERWDKFFDLPVHMNSAYDNVHVPWGSTHETSWIETKKYPHVAGLYIWTGFDYLGEPTPFGWPSRSSFFGIVDLAGIPKDVYYMYQSEWTNTPVLHLFPHWNWTEGQEIDIWAYYNEADEVELFVNGESQGSQSKTEDKLHVSWRVPYRPGTLKAVSRKNGTEILSKEIHTAGEPAKIALIPDRSTIRTDKTDLSFVAVEIQDKDGNLVPDAGHLIRFEVEGSGFITGTDNGDQNDSRSLKAPERHAFFGKAVAVVQNTGVKGVAKLRASADGLPDAVVEIVVK